MKVIQYPNLKALVQYHPYHISTFADHAGTTMERFAAILEGKEVLYPEEAERIARLTGVPSSVLLLPSLVLLDPERLKHRRMLKELAFAYEAGKKYVDSCGGAQWSQYMDYDGLILDNLIYKYKAGKASYMEYIGLVESIKHNILFAEHAARKKAKEVSL